MDSVYVVEQPIVCNREPFPLRFAEEASALLKSTRGVASRPVRRVLLLLGTSEAALDSAIAVLGARYGGDLQAADRRVRFREPPLMQPIMDVFVRAPRAHGDAVSHDLEQRGATPRFKIIDPRGWLIRAEAPMAALLDYERKLSELSDGAADCWITLNRWEPVAPDDGGRAA